MQLVDRKAQSFFFFKLISSDTPLLPIQKSHIHICSSSVPDGSIICCNIKPAHRQTSTQNMFHFKKNIDRINVKFLKPSSPFHLTLTNTQILNYKTPFIENTFKNSVNLQVKGFV